MVLQYFESKDKEPVFIWVCYECGYLKPCYKVEITEEDEEGENEQ